tara:strand:- start:608 stop:2275 length:1668 start_codon:yes stop_codon:yes gene_type:complete
MVKCVCGEKEVYQYPRDHYEVTKEGETLKASENGVHFGKCSSCGIVRQTTLPYSNDKELEEYYRNYPPVKKAYGVKGYKHDRGLAMDRWPDYGILKDDKVLDVGSGSGAFVDVCREHGVEAWGCEIAEYHHQGKGEFIYKKRLEDIHFPVDHFDKVTCHDVLEHVLDPIKFLKELFRVTGQEGTCIVDFPRFFHREGKHHWKQEHIWFFGVEELKSVCKSVGFEVTDTCFPIESKVTIYLRKPKQNRPKILVPPGMGDAYWSMVKLQSFLKQKKLEEVADIYVACNRERQYDGHRRAFPFIELFPFCKSTGITYSTNDYPQKLWLEAYRDAGRTVFEDICGCDYFISYNGHMGHGSELNKIDPEIKCNWIPPMFESLEQVNYTKWAKKKFGKYILFYFLFHGHYGRWIKEFNLNQMAGAVRLVTEQTGYAPIFVGAQWDKEFPEQTLLVNSVSNCIDLRGKTSVDEIFGLIKGSECVVGYPSGLTIMSTVLKKKTLIIWNDYYHKNFQWNCCPPEVRRKTYQITNTKGLKPQALATSVKTLINKYIPKNPNEDFI